MTVLIIVESKDLAADFARVLSVDNTVHTCSDRNAALEQLETLRPDALVIDVRILFKMDPLPYKPTVILATTYFVSRTVLEQAASIGVNEMLILPCSLDYLACRIREMLSLAAQQSIQADWRGI